MRNAHAHKLSDQRLKQWFVLKNVKNKPDMVVDACNPSTRQATPEGQQVQGQPGLK